MKRYMRIVMVALAVVGVAAVALGILDALSSPGVALREMSLDTALLGGVLVALCAIYFKIDGGNPRK